MLSAPPPSGRRKYFPMCLRPCASPTEMSSVDLPEVVTLVLARPLTRRQSPANCQSAPLDLLQFSLHPPPSPRSTPADHHHSIPSLTANFLSRYPSIFVNIPASNVLPLRVPIFDYFSLYN
ncbi:hypothetical protein Salat_2223500 [Sesamum alatum]|uniref:Uncharacterized protein n=1 Tax=Sesamum alatum TaxID=300844 RepID=A0AAE1XV66_9LAMI|nr:hypothetical protein Salat_2223500 [Sesamum alatum]